MIGNALVCMAISDYAPDFIICIQGIVWVMVSDSPVVSLRVPSLPCMVINDSIALSKQYYYTAIFLVMENAIGTNMDSVKCIERNKLIVTKDPST